MDQMHRKGNRPPNYFFRRHLMYTSFSVEQVYIFVIVYKKYRGKKQKIKTIYIHK